MSKFLDKRNSDALYRAIVSIQTEEECRSQSKEVQRSPR